jgi:Aspartyl protease
MDDTKSDLLIQLHVNWLGGRETLEKLQNITASGALVTAGIEGSLITQKTRLGWWRQEVRLGIASIAEVRGPKGGRVLNWSGQVEPMSAARMESGDRDTLRSFARHLLEDIGAKRRYLGSESRDERDWQVIRFDFPNGDYFDLLLDRRDGSCSWIRKRQDTRTFWIRLDDWRMVSGVRLPFEQRTFHDDPGLDSIVRWRTLTINQALAAADFDPPRPSPRTVHIAGEESSTPWIPVDLVEGRYVIVQGKVGDREVPILLDSGANNTVLAEDFAHELGLSLAGRMVLQGTSRSQWAAFTAGIPVEIGMLRLPGLIVLVTALAAVEEALGRKVPIILGKEVFNSVVVEIDYPGSRLAFHRPESYRPEPGAKPLRLLPGESGDKLVELSIEGLPPARFILDSGSGSTVTLFKSYVEEQGLLDERFPRSERLLRGVGGGSVVTIATLKTLTLAGLELKDVPAEFYREDQGAFHTRRAAGNLGAGILSLFRVALDYSRGRMYLSPGPVRGRDAFCKNRVGLELDYRGTFLEVAFVAPGSPAAKAGWTAGRRIIAIDHQPIGSDSLTSDAAARWICGKPGSTITLTDADGVHHEFVLTEYY